ncbi:MAG: hypothetical protein Q8R02_23270 [Hyphomonadaceae bacterium]|nr:hypothetical protein [Hyphomonadaceae bacterium]
MSDHGKLRELVNAAYACRNAGSDVLDLAGFWPLVEAAESTLPKTKMVWTVEGAGRRYAPYTRTCEAEDRETLNSYVECLHGDGFLMVTITSCEVPA